MRRATGLSTRETRLGGARIRTTDERRRPLRDLEGATGHGHTSQALDDTARLCAKLRSDTRVVPTGRAKLLVDASTTTDVSVGDN
ncbi:hypothetical protein [Halobaculum sp. MBLA0143]|uniref:hypothetical protein n=1 Tax=Halobaculum sp. MBLA0143 TaxID=3079933 RepID=UPI0035237CED